MLQGAKPSTFGYANPCWRAPERHIAYSKVSHQTVSTLTFATELKKLVSVESGTQKVSHSTRTPSTSAVRRIDVESELRKDEKLQARTQPANRKEKPQRANESTAKSTAYTPKHANSPYRLCKTADRARGYITDSP